MREEHQASVGSQIAQLREQRGWSQRALAKWVGLDQSALSRIEAGRRRITAEELHRLAHALGVSTDALLGAATAPPAASPTPHGTGMRRAELPSPAAAYAMGSDARLDLDESPHPALMPDAAPLMARAAPVDAGPATGQPTPVHRGLAEPGTRPSAPWREQGKTGPAALPQAVAAVIDDWFALRDLVGAGGVADAFSVGRSAEGKPAVAAAEGRWDTAGTAQRDVLFDRVARFWRAELHVEADGPLPDLVTLLEDGLGVQVVVARVAPEGERGSAAGGSARSSDRPVCGSVTRGGVAFLFVNAARPVVLQRYALAHGFAHLALGHGDIVDRRIEWSRKNPTESAANDFAEELLAPAGAVARWYERHDEPEPDLDTLLQLGNAFGISAWSALYRSRAAGRVRAKQFTAVADRLRRHEWELLPRQAFLGGLRDTLSAVTPDEVRPPGEFGPPGVLRLPAAMRHRTLRGLRQGSLSLEHAADLLRLSPAALAAELTALGLE